MARLILCLLIAFSSTQIFAAPEVRTVPPGNQSWGPISVQIPAQSVFQYTPVVMCDSFDFQVKHFSSVFQNGMLFVELRYRMQGHPLGASCNVFFVEDDLEEFDFATGEPMLSAPQSFRFVVQN